MALEAVRQVVEEVAKVVGGGYCRLQMPLRRQGDSGWV